MYSAQGSMISTETSKHTSTGGTPGETTEHQVPRVKGNQGTEAAVRA